MKNTIPPKRANVHKTRKLAIFLPVETLLTAFCPKPVLSEAFIALVPAVLAR